MGSEFESPEGYTAPEASTGVIDDDGFDVDEDEIEDYGDEDEE